MTAVKRLVALVVLAGLCYAGWWGYHAYLAEKGEALEASGTVEATTVQLSARAPGTLETLAAREGDSVRRGQVLATLTRNDLVAQRERDAMALLKAEAQLNDLLSGARAQEIKNAEANLEMARLSCEKSAAELQRREALFEAGALAQEELDRYRVAAQLDRQRLAAAEAQLALLREGSRPEAVAAARAEVERSRAVLKASE
ncbi:MAG: biotin/lipoyl-binding protein, partial [Syntrophomonadaceae bacterium]|nr:biotin/lipoyl-binding protein [Syntrophomonadaceae bacterium]